MIGPEQPIQLPASSQQVDYEAELVVVMGRRAAAVPAARALEYVAGYTNGHDVSARDWQLQRNGQQWLLGKTFDTFAPTVARRPPVFLQPGDVCEVEVEGLGILRNRCVAAGPR